MTRTELIYLPIEQDILRGRRREFSSGLVNQIITGVVKRKIFVTDINTKVYIYNKRTPMRTFKKVENFRRSNFHASYYEQPDSQRHQF